MSGILPENRIICVDCVNPSTGRPASAHRIEADERAAGKGRTRITALARLKWKSQLELYSRCASSRQ
jgi:hypothetical protein